MKENSSIKQRVLRTEPIIDAPHAEPSTVNSHTLSAKTQSIGREDEIDERLRGAAQAASDKKALDMVALDLRSIASFTDYFLITSGTNTRQVQAIADEVVERLKKQGTRAARVEGYKTAEWVLIDYGDFVVHVFEDKARRFYDLERLWREGTRVEIPLDDGRKASNEASRSEER